ncbi:molecular chaperone Hsp33 [Pseudidiomarina tainanensis]|uniref:Molecular chaperone Hsp33 n=4 Tax=Pseudidiomarina TaxID=2800384 RepID=A0A368UMF9_9GAMM|nr:molecular chaperone Hsp33 [Pseudidiomarina maritima]RBP87942.1 molecular chaperone Hsp33 [Pseudidiomarina tainanensis]RCW29939.1 molecular chaperone Hsp33 [Pseudidiomarina tainanensis]
MPTTSYINITVVDEPMNYPTDQLLRYTFIDQDVRGELVQLTSSYQRMLQGHDYAAPVQRLLGELMAATSLLTATLKFEGHIALQLQGDGPINFLAVNGSHHQQLRGIARVREAISDEQTGLRELLGKAVMVITLTPLEGERYQGVVSGDGDSIAEIIENYFMQSEQLNTRLWLHADGEHAAGMLLQVMPAAGKDLTGFEHLQHLTATMTAAELYSLPGTEVLHRLYHEEQVEVYPPMPVSFECGCSRERTLEALATVEPSELHEILTQDGEIVMTCEYCNAQYVFSEADLVG